MMLSWKLMWVLNSNSVHWVCPLEQQRLEATEAAEAALALSSAPSANSTGNANMVVEVGGDSQTLATASPDGVRASQTQAQVQIQ